MNWSLKYTNCIWPQIKSLFSESFRVAPRLHVQVSLSGRFTFLLLGNYEGTLVSLSLCQSQAKLFPWLPVVLRWWDIISKSQSIRMSGCNLLMPNRVRVPVAQIIGDRLISLATNCSVTVMIGHQICRKAKWLSQSAIRANRSAGGIRFTLRSSFSSNHGSWLIADDAEMGFVPCVLNSVSFSFLFLSHWFRLSP